MGKYRLRVKAGFGDCIQINIILKHIRHYDPQAYIIIETRPHIARQWIFSDTADQVIDLVYPWNQDKESKNYYLHFIPSERPFGSTNCPNTKVLRSLKEEFKLQPIEKLFVYDQKIVPDEYLQLAEDKYAELSELPIILIHAEGANRKLEKDLPDKTQTLLQEVCRHYNRYPLLLDFNSWEFTGLPYRSEMIAALIESAELFIGIDSFPAHLAGCLTTPTLVLWRDFFPCHNFDLCSNEHLYHIFGDSAMENCRYDSAWECFIDKYPAYYYGEDSQLDYFMVSLLEDYFGQS